MGHTPLGVPCASAAQSRDAVDSPTQYRQYLTEMLAQQPARLPNEMDQGFPLPDGDVSVTPALRVRRSTWQATGAVCTLRLSLVMPSRMARTAAVDTARALRQWGGRVPPWPPSSAALPWAGSGPGGPAAARRLSAPRSQRRRSGPALWWPMSRCPGWHGHRSTARRLLAAAVSWACAWSRPPRRSPGSGAMARVPRTPRAAGRRITRARSAPRAGTPRARRGARCCPRARWGGAFSPRSGRGSTPARVRGGARDSRGPGRALRPRPHGSVPRVCGAWRRGPRRLAAGRWPRGWCRGVAVGPTAPPPMLVHRPTAPPRRSIDCAPLQTDGSTPGAPATPPPRAPGWRYAPWRGQGTVLPLAHACGGTSRRGWLPVTPATACSLTHTGCITA